MARRKVSNPLALAVLACVGERPMHPYEISATLKERGKHYSIKLNFGSLYSVVETLQKHGLIAPQETVREGRRPERTIYAITEAGKAEFDDWLTELLSTPVKEYTQLEAGLSLMVAFPPDRVVDLLDQRTERLRQELSDMHATSEQMIEIRLPRIFWIEHDFVVAMRTAELEFVTGLADSIRDGSFPGTDLWRRLSAQVAAGISFEELRSDPVKYLGEEVSWLAPDYPTRVAEATEKSTS